MTRDDLRRGRLRTLSRAEHSIYAEHLRRLDDGDRRRRFLRAMSDEALVAHAERLRDPDITVVGWFVDGALCGAVEIALFRGIAEAGFSVERAWRNRGIGGRLMARAIRLSRQRHVRSLTIFTMAENLPMVRLAARAGFAIERHGLEIEGIRPIAPPDAAMLAFDAALDRTGLAVESVRASVSLAAAGQRAMGLLWRPAERRAA